MNSYKVKFFGSKKEREQIQLMKFTIEAVNKEEVIRFLKQRYKVINGLKISEEPISSKASVEDNYLTELINKI